MKTKDEIQRKGRDFSVKTESSPISFVKMRNVCIFAISKPILFVRSCLQGGLAGVSGVSRYSRSGMFRRMRDRRFGLMAEWLGKGLQNLVQRFESASDLTETALQLSATRFSFCFVIHLSYICHTRRADDAFEVVCTYTMNRSNLSFQRRQSGISVSSREKKAAVWSGCSR